MTDVYMPGGSLGSTFSPMFAPETAQLRMNLHKAHREQAVYRSAGQDASWLVVDNDLVQAWETPSVTRRLSAEAKAAIGARGVARLRAFEVLTRGWDGRDAEPINFGSVDTLSAFFRDTMLKPLAASVFMGYDGCLAIAWDDAGGEVEVRFRPNEVDIYREALDRDAVFARSDIGFTAARAFIADQKP